MFNSQAGATSKFAAGGQTGSFNHQHASQMGHAAALRLQAARALSGRPTAPVMRPTGGAAGNPGGDAAMGNYKVQIAQAAQQHGVPIHVGQIHGAIDQMTAKGMMSPQQGVALKRHNGPLHGPQGQHVMRTIAAHIVSPTPPPALGMTPGA